MQTMENRQQRRSKPKHKGQVPAVVNPSQSRLLHQRVATVESSLSRLVEVSDQNTAVFSDSLRSFDNLSVVLQRVMNDMVNGTVRCFGDIPAETETGRPVRVGVPSQIDFQSYFLEFQLCLVFTGFATWLKSISKQDEPVLVTATKDEVVEFGG